MKVSIKRLFNENGQETGAILRVMLGGPTNVQQKIITENQLIQYGFDILYQGEGLNIFRDIYVDTPSVTIIRNIDDLSETEISI